jgi:hypothetical protein
MPARRRPRLLTMERRPVQQPNWPPPIATSILEPREYSPRSASLALFIRCAGLPCASHLAEDDDLARLPHRWSSRTQNFHAWLLLLVLFIYANKDPNSVQVKRKNGSNDFTAERFHTAWYMYVTLVSWYIVRSTIQLSARTDCLTKSATLQNMFRIILPTTKLIAWRNLQRCKICSCLYGFI